jgi:hypothetical protein
MPFSILTAETRYVGFMGIVSPRVPTDSRIARQLSTDTPDIAIPTSAFVTK